MGKEGESWELLLLMEIEKVEVDWAGELKTNADFHGSSRMNSSLEKHKLLNYIYFVMPETLDLWTLLVLLFPKYLESLLCILFTIKNKIMITIFED